MYILVDTLPQIFFQFLKEMFPRDKDANRQADLASKILNVRLAINPKWQALQLHILVVYSFHYKFTQESPEKVQKGQKHWI